MAEPIVTPAAVTLTAAAAAVPAITAFGVNLGLRADVLVAGFAGAMVAVVLLNSVPSKTEDWLESIDNPLVRALAALIKDSIVRITFAVSSAMLAGYVTPLSLYLANIPDALLLGMSFVVGAGAQKILRSLIDRFSKTEGDAK